MSAECSGAVQHPDHWAASPPSTSLLFSDHLLPLLPGQAAAFAWEWQSKFCPVTKPPLDPINAVLSYLAHPIRVLLETPDLPELPGVVLSWEMWEYTFSSLCQGEASTHDCCVLGDLPSAWERALPHHF